MTKAELVRAMRGVPGGCEITIIAADDSLVRVVEVSYWQPSGHFGIVMLRPERPCETVTSEKTCRLA
jgi:hypothetical protein